MATKREIVSLVKGLLRIENSDNMINSRVILSELRRNTMLLVKRENNQRKLFGTDSIFTTIPCLELVEVPISECCDFVDECTIARSKIKLPKILESNYLYTIQGVYGINLRVKLTEITINSYLQLLKLPNRVKQNYYWINNDYLYITNPLVKSVKLIAAFEDDVSKEMLFPECACNPDEHLDDWCKNPLDEDFKCPGYLEAQVIEMTTKKLLGTYFSTAQDSSSDGKDNQAKNLVKPN